MSFLILAIWFAIILALNLMGVFHASDGPPLPLLIAVLAPTMAFALMYASVEGFRAKVLAIDPVLLIAVQGWRVIGVMFLVLYGYDMLPGSFAWPAGVGDMLVGVYAPFVVVTMIRKTRNWQRHVMTLNIMGLLDFVGAVGFGVLSGTGPLGILVEPGGVTTELMQELPLALIPTFFVPMFILAHIISILQLRKNIR